MSQGQVNDIKNNAQFLGFKNDRRVIPLFYDFPCKFIKIKWELRRCWLKKLYSSLFSLARPLSKNDTWGQNGPCFCFPQTVICYLLSVPQKNHFWKLSTVTQKWSLKSEVWSLREWSLSSYENLSPYPPCDPWIFLDSLKARNLWRKSLIKYGLWPEIIIFNYNLQL